MTMRAAICTAYGPPDVIRIETRPDPVPGPGMVRVSMRAAAVTRGDARVRGFDLPAGMRLMGRLAIGLRRPRRPILGPDGAGIVDAVGPGVTRFRPGDAVMICPDAAMGCHADHRLMPETGAIAAMPPGLGFAEAASLVFGANTALTFLRGKAGLRAGERVLVIGAAGPVGLAAVQIAAADGATVSALARPAHHDRLRALGAAAVAADLGAAPGPFDLVLDTTGAFGTATLRERLAPRGRVALVAAGLGPMLGTLANPLRRQKVICAYAGGSRASLETIAALAAAGALVPVIDLALPFAQIAAAHARLAERGRIGTVVVTFD
ncbi:MAG: zinc-binding alcohol dehydrogenase family protein [Gemmobacter sp.]